MISLPLTNRSYSCDLLVNASGFLVFVVICSVFGWIWGFFRAELSFTMNEIPVAAQQLIVDSIKALPHRSSRVVLCHTAGQLSSDETCQVCTHDKFDEHLLRNSIELTTVLPNTGVIRQALKNYKDEPVSFEAVFSCHHSADPLSVSTEVLGKFGTDCDSLNMWGPSSIQVAKVWFSLSRWYFVAWPIAVSYGLLSQEEVLNPPKHGAGQFVTAPPVERWLSPVSGVPWMWHLIPLPQTWNSTLEISRSEALNHNIFLL